MNRDDPQKAPDVDAAAFPVSISRWGRHYFQDFPWRHTRDPYHLLMAEVMLHRTRAAQVAPVWVRFMERFPAPGALAAAPVEDLHDALYSLGLRLAH